MEKQIVQVELEKETTNTIRYKEKAAPGAPPILGTIYIPKWVLGDSPPHALEVTISEPSAPKAKKE